MKRSVVDVSVEAGDPALAGPLEDDALALLGWVGLHGVELSVVIVDDAAIQALNLQWRGKDAPTDVLSFSMREGEGDADDPLLGDLVISLPTAARQAAELGHPVDHELRVLLIHGLLHLLGEDHERGPAEAAAMAARERELLLALDPECPWAGLIARSGAAG